MKGLGLAFVLGLGILSACQSSNTPAASVAASVPLSNADQPTVKGAGASAAPSGQIAAPTEDAPVVIGLYRVGHELDVLRAVAILIGCVLIATLLTIGIPLPLRRSALPLRRERQDSRRSRAA